MRRGVTLIELLITMAIMAIISAAILGTASAAMESARRSRTQQLITKIHGLLLEHLASYETRRLAIDPAIVYAIDSYVASATTPQMLALRNVERGQMLADARLIAVRELMKMEMPDTAADVHHVPQVLATVPTLNAAYRRMRTTASQNANDTAECLYLTVMKATGDGEARTLFAKQDIGDTDEDGAPEFIDGWGEPIKWIRWPSGLVSDLQPIDANGNRASDPLDPFRRDRQLAGNAEQSPSISVYPPRLATAVNDNIRYRYKLTVGPPNRSAFRLVPLVYSAGPDGAPAFLVAKNDGRQPLDPFRIMSDGTQAGAVDAATASDAKDNITNHLIEY